jgi:hypothetical protein
MCGEVPRANAGKATQLCSVSPSLDSAVFLCFLAYIRDQVLSPAAPWTRLEFRTVVSAERRVAERFPAPSDRSSYREYKDTVDAQIS